MQKFKIRSLTPQDRDKIKEFMIDAWGSEKVVSCGVLHEAYLLPGFAAYEGDKLAGLVTYNIEDRDCEIVTLDSLIENRGIGWRLIEHVLEKAHQAECNRLWLITTNDNIHAFRYYQKRGFTIADIHVNALEKSRELKPQIPKIGMHGIPLRDEIIFEMPVNENDSSE